MDRQLFSADQKISNEINKLRNREKTAIGGFFPSSIFH